MTDRSSLDLGHLRGGAGGRRAVPLSTALRHVLVTGTTGWGKSGLLLSAMLPLLTRHERVGVVLVDPKGETAMELRDRFLPAVAELHPHIRPEEIVSIAPFSNYGVALNPLQPLPGLSTEVQANLVCAVVGSLVEGGLGPRMTGILAWLCRAVIELRGSLADVVRILIDDSFRAGVAGRVADPFVREYLSVTFEGEPRTSRDSLRARLEWLLLLPPMRSMLCADGCLRGSDLIEAPITIVDLGGAPQGFVALSRFVGSFVFSLVTGACFSRPVQPRTHPVVIFVDEWQELVRVAADDFERLLAQARFRRISLWLANQSLAQVDEVSPSLTRILQANIALHAAFRPEATDLKHLDALLAVTGRQVDPDRPDRLLDRAEERRRLLETLRRLPPRHALLGDMVEGRADVIRTLTLPYQAAERQAEALPPERIEAFRRGRFGVPFSELPAAQIGRSLAAEPESVPVAPGRRSTRSRNRPGLELP